MKYQLLCDGEFITEADNYLEILRALQELVDDFELDKKEYPSLYEPDEKFAYDYYCITEIVAEDDKLAEELEKHKEDLKNNS